jgi:hypothetical protein
MKLFMMNIKLVNQVTGTVFQKLPFGIIVEVEKMFVVYCIKMNFHGIQMIILIAYVKIGDEVDTLSLSTWILKKNALH